jgi:hypothetical protein
MKDLLDRNNHAREWLLSSRVDAGEFRTKVIENGAAKGR